MPTIDHQGGVHGSTTHRKLVDVHGDVVVRPILKPYLRSDECPALAAQSVIRGGPYFDGELCGVGRICR